MLARGNQMDGVSFKNEEVEKAMIAMCERDLMPPTIRLVQEAMGFQSPNAVMVHIGALVKAGRVLQLGGNTSRTYVPASWYYRVKEAMRITKNLSIDDMRMIREIWSV